jgi:hypothetical protein
MKASPKRRLGMSLGKLFHVRLDGRDLVITVLISYEIQAFEHQ